MKVEEGDKKARWHLGCPRNASAADGRCIARGDVHGTEACFISSLFAGLEENSGAVLALKHLHSLIVLTGRLAVYICYVRAATTSD